MSEVAELPFEFAKGACTVLSDDTIMLCFGQNSGKGPYLQFSTKILKSFANMEPHSQKSPVQETYNITNGNQICKHEKWTNSFYNAQWDYILQSETFYSHQDISIATSTGCF